MQVVVLAGGIGSRLWPLTSSLPKPLLPVLNRPLLVHLLERFKLFGVDEAMLAVHYRSEQIEAYFKENPIDGLEISCPREPKPLGTAGAVKNVAHKLQSTFLVGNGDIFTDLDIGKAIAFHRANKAEVTIVLAQVANPSLYGMVETMASDRILRFVEKPKSDEITTNWVNAGTYIMEPSAIEAIPDDRFFMFEKDLFPLLLRNRVRVYGFKSGAYWLDMGTHNTYLQLHEDLLSRRPGPVLPEINSIAPSAELLGPVLIGPGTIISDLVRVVGPTSIGQECRIGVKTLVRRSVVLDHVIIGERVEIEQSIIGRGVRIGDDVRVPAGCCLGDGVIVRQGTDLPMGLNVDPGSEIGSELHD